MGRGVSAGGGQSSLGYLFGGGETTSAPPAAQNQGKGQSNEPSPKSAADSPPAVMNVPAGVNSKNANNYFRADGQNCGNFITDRPSTKVHAAPGGGSSLGYLFDGSSQSKK